MMSRRAELRRAARDAHHRQVVNRQIEQQLPAVPGVVPEWSDEYVEQAISDAHRLLPQVPGTRVEVMSYERTVGLPLVEEAWGTETALMIAGKLRAAGPDALVLIACRVPHSWHRTAAGEFCCDDPACESAVTHG